MQPNTFLELSRQAIKRNDASHSNVNAVLYLPSPTGYFGIFTSGEDSKLFTTRYNNYDKVFSVSAYERTDYMEV